jgi:hypothetical protein
MLNTACDIELVIKKNLGEKKWKKTEPEQTSLRSL